MKLSELIKELSELKDKCGDLNVYLMDNEYGNVDVIDVRYFHNIDNIYDKTLNPGISLLQ